MLEESHVVSAITAITSRKRARNEEATASGGQPRFMLGATFSEIQKEIEKPGKVVAPPVPLEKLLLRMIRNQRLISINPVFVTPEILRYDNERMARR